MSLGKIIYLVMGIPLVCTGIRCWAFWAKGKSHFFWFLGFVLVTIGIDSCLLFWDFLILFRYPWARYLILGLFGLSIIETVVRAWMGFKLAKTQDVVLQDNKDDI